MGETDTNAGILATWRTATVPAKALLVGIFVNRLGSFIQVFLVLFLTARGFSEVQAGAALGTYTIGAVLGAIIGGTLTDLLGPRRTILLSMTGTAALVLSILYLHNYLLLLVAVVVIGTVNGAYRPASNALLSELTPPHQQVMIFAIYRLAYNVGNTAAPLLGAAFIAVSYDLLFWGEAAAALGYAAIAAIALPRRAPAPAPAPVDAAAVKPAATEDQVGYRAVLTDRRYLLFLGAAFLNALVYVQYLSTLPVAMRTAGLGTAWFSAVVAMNGLLVIAFELLVTKVVQRWPMRIAALLGFVLLGAGMAAYALPFGAAVFVIGTLVWTVAEMVGGPTMFAYPAVAGPAHLRGRYIGAATALFGVGSACGSLFGLAVWSRIGEAVWWWCGILAVVGAVPAWFGIRRSAGASTSDDPPVTPPLDPAAAGDSVTHGVERVESA